MSMQLKRRRSDSIKIANNVDVVMTKETALPLAKVVTDVVGRTTLLKKCKQNDSNSKSHNRPRSKGDHDKCKSCGKYKKDFHSVEMDSDCEGCSNINQMEDLMEKIQSLFYHLGNGRQLVQLEMCDLGDQWN